jgi:hypothetical protein
VDGATGPTGATGATGATGSTPAFITGSGQDSNNKTFTVMSGVTFTANTIYCATVSAPGAGKSVTFTVSYGGSSKGTCVVSGTDTTSSGSLTSFSAAAGSVVTVVTSEQNSPTRSQTTWSIVP